MGSQDFSSLQYIVVMRFLLPLLLVSIFIFEIDAKGSRFRFGRSRLISSWRSSASRGGGRSGYGSSSVPKAPVHPKWFTSSKPRKYRSLSPIISTSRGNAKRTEYGTKVSDSMLRERKKGMSRRAFGLGLGAGFLAGTGIGFGSSLAAYSVYHRYMVYLQMKHHLAETYRLDYLEDIWDQDYYENWYKSNKCEGGCPQNSHCEWAVCDCNENYERAFGKCRSNVPDMINRRLKLNPDNKTLKCSKHEDCFVHDMNLICTNGICGCRRNMKWNSKALECQLFLDVDCSNIGSRASGLAKKAANRAKAREELNAKLRKDQKCELLQCEKHSRRKWDFTIFEDCYKKGCQVLPACKFGDGLTPYFIGRIRENQCDSNIRIYNVMLISNVMSSLNSGDILEKKYESLPNRTQTPKESLKDSLLHQDFSEQELASLSKDSLDELFCRDVEAFSEAFQIYEDERPGNCPELDKKLCAALYDSSTCSGGWTLNITQNEQTQMGFFSYWKYRNDADLAVVKSGCTLTVWDDSDFSGGKAIIGAGVKDRWVVFANYSSPKKDRWSNSVKDFAGMDENIESFKCSCRT